MRSVHRRLRSITEHLAPSQAAAEAGPPGTYIDPDTGIQYAELVYPGKGATPERVEHLEKHGYVILVRHSTLILFPSERQTS